MLKHIKMIQKLYKIILQQVVHDIPNSIVLLL